MFGKFITKNAQRFPPNVRFGDIVRGLPVEAGSCHGVYASHVLEHLTLDEFHSALHNTKKMLCKGGILRIVLPDLELAARDYIRRLEQGDSSANEIFLNETFLGRRNRRRGLVGDLYRAISRHFHLWMWDTSSLIDALERHGYHSVRRCSFGDCEDPMFTHVESQQRFQRAIALEARG